MGMVNVATYIQGGPKISQYKENHH